jgi:hypothetical protein
MTPSSRPCLLPRISLTGVSDNRGVAERVCVLIVPIQGAKEFYANAHIAGVRDGKLVVAGGLARMNGLDPIEDVRREIALSEIRRVELVEKVPDND